MICRLFCSPRFLDQTVGQTAGNSLCGDDTLIFFDLLFLIFIRPCHGLYKGVQLLDITCIPIKKGFMYLVAIIDMHSRYIVAWSLSNTMDAECVASSVMDAFAHHGTPEILNSDQGSQFTCVLYTKCLRDAKVDISKDGK